LDGGFTEQLVGEIGEPACGNGAMSRVLPEHAGELDQSRIGSDIEARGFGDDPPCSRVMLPLFTAERRGAEVQRHS
jgi:hypothetical protein